MMMGWLPPYYYNSPNYLVSTTLKLLSQLFGLKAFSLLQKLEHYVIRGVANEWFSSSYQKNRKQFVSIGNVSSTIKELLTGVPQGSVLGPLLFLLYINDLHNSARYAKTYNFVDDTCVILFSTSLEILSKRIKKICLTFPTG